MSDLSKIAVEIGKLRAELMTASAAANFSEALTTSMILTLINKGIFTRDEGLNIVEAVRGSLSSSGQEFIDTHSSVRQALNRCVDLRQLIEKM